MEREIIQQEKLIEFHPKTSLCFISKGKVVNLSFEEITHLSKYGTEVVIYTLSKDYRTSYSLQDLMNELPVNDFFRIHKSHIISLTHMNGIKRKRICVREYYLPYTDYYKSQLIKSLGERLKKGYSYTLFQISK